jgi:hypothetical protein
MLARMPLQSDAIRLPLPAGAGTASKLITGFDNHMITENRARSASTVDISSRIASPHRQTDIRHYADALASRYAIAQRRGVVIHLDGWWPL